MNSRPALRLAFAAILTCLGITWLASQGRAACVLDSLLLGKPAAPVGAGPFGITAGDFNADSIPDLAFAVLGENSVKVLLGVGDGTFGQPSVYPAGSSPTSVVATDLDGDGILDLIVSDGDPVASAILVLKGLGSGGVGNGHFAPAVAYPSGPQVYRVAVGDFNHDGHPDIAATFFGSNRVGVYLNNGDGTFPALVVSYPTGLKPYGVEAADLNGDGVADLVVGNQDGNTISVLLNNGDGTFRPTVNYLASGYNYEVRVADLDGDGAPDLVVVQSSNEAGVGVLMGHLSAGLPDGTFGAVTSNTTSSRDRASLVVADLDHDGRLDIAVTEPSSGKLEILRGFGDGSFAHLPTVYPVDGYPWELTAADFNHDGMLDLVTGGYRGGNFTVLLGRCASTLPPPPPPCPGSPLFDPAVYVGTGGAPFGIGTGDFNGDHIPDLVVANLGQNRLQVLIGRPNATYSNPVPFYAGEGPIGVATADFNGDGILDLVAADASQNANSVGVLLGLGSGGVGDGNFGLLRQFPAGAQPFAVIAGDFDADGRQDLAVADYADHRVAVLLGNGDGTFRVPVFYPCGDRPYGLASADLDGDGIPDLVVGSEGTKDVTILKGVGDGTFSWTESWGAAGPAYSVAVGDFNHDGLPDIAMINGGTPTIGVLLAISPGHFTGAKNYQVTTNGPLGLVAADFNHDGILDLAVGNSSGGSVDVLIGLESGGHGNGAFSAPFNFRAGPVAARLVAADLDRDGTPDLAVADYAGGWVSILRGGCRLVTDVLVSDARAEAEDGAVRLSWSVASDGPVEFQVSRSTALEAGYLQVASFPVQQGREEYSWRDNTAQPGLTYFYKIAYRQSGAWKVYGPVRVQAAAARFALRGTAPNPSRGPVRIDYEMDRAGPVRLEVFDLSGRRVARLVDGQAPAGRASVQWNPRVEGTRLPAGAYFVRLSSGARQESRKLVVAP